MYRIYDHANEDFLTDEEFETPEDARQFLQTFFFYDYDKDLFGGRDIDELTLEDWQESSNIEVYDSKHDYTI